MRHQLAHRGLEVVVADGPARDAGRAGAGPALVEDHDILTPAEPAGPQFPGQVPGRGQPVDARADDDVPAVSGDHGTCLPDLRRPAAQSLHKVARLCDHAQRGGTLDETEILWKATPWPANRWWRSATR